MKHHGRLNSELPEKLFNRILVSLGFAALVYVCFLIWTDWRSFSSAIAAFPLMILIPVIVLTLFNYTLRYLRFAVYLRALDISISSGRSVGIFLAGLAGTVTPGKLGEVLKSFLLRRDAGAPLCTTAPIVVAERFTDVIALVLLSIIGLGELGGSTVIYSILAGLVIILTIVLSSHRSLSNFLQRVRTRPGMVGSVANRLLFAHDSTNTLLSPRMLLVPSILAVTAWFFECIGFYLVLRGFGLEIGIVNATFIKCFSTLLGAAAMLPGGVGPTEATMTALLMNLHVPSAEAVAATLIIRACTLWLAAVIGSLALAFLPPSHQKHSHHVQPDSNGETLS